MWFGACGVFLVAICRPDQCRPGDLSNGCDDIANNKNPQYRLGRQWNVFCANTVGHDGDDGVYGGGKEDRGDNDKEVLHNKICETVRVLLT